MYIGGIYKPQFYEIENLSYRLYYNENDNKVYVDQNLEFNVIDNGDFIEVSYNGLNLPNNKNYYLELYYKSGYIETSFEYKFVEINENKAPTGNPIYSGDHFNDFTLTNQLLNELNNNINFYGYEINTSLKNVESGNTAILEQLKANESGEQERFNIFKEMFNGLFTIGSGDLKELNDEIKEKFNFEAISGIEEEKNFFEQFASLQPLDFVISWNDIIYENVVLIPHGEINFSKYVRENETIRQMHSYMQTILVFALSFLLIRNIWYTFVILLGIGSEIYEKDQEENQIVESHHDTIDYNTGNVTSSYTIKKGRNSITMKGKPTNNKRL